MVGADKNAKYSCASRFSSDFGFNNIQENIKLETIKIGVTEPGLK